MINNIENLLASEAERHTGPEQALLSAASNTIISLREHLRKANNRCRKLDALEECGVDNWEGYDEAMRLFNNPEDDDQGCF